MSDIELLDHCASDLSVVNAARVSFNKWHDEMQEGDDKIIQFLLKNHHGTPFEHGYFQFRVTAPLFVFREWHRHRTGHSYNEMSARYTEIPEEFYLPDTIRAQFGKPGAYTFRELDSTHRLERWKQLKAQRIMRRQNKGAFKRYRQLMGMGVAKEQARAVLPVAMHSQMIWSCNPRSMMHFLGLRNAPSAMKEIRELASLVEYEFAQLMPVTYAAFNDNGRVAP